jgi:caffeoyl-CoA O-methyltransferase
MTSFKSVPLTQEIHDYIVTEMAPLDDAQRNLIAETVRLFPADSHLQIAPEQGPLLTLLTRILNAKNAIEVGTFTGYSALCIARGLSADGHLWCCDVNDEWANIGRASWVSEGISTRITLFQGPAADTILSLPQDELFDFAFVDADKGGYWTYHELLLPRMRPGGLIVYDNVLYRGEVIHSNATGDPAHIREFNRRLAADVRVDLAVLAAADGMTLALKR